MHALNLTSTTRELEVCTLRVHVHPSISRLLMAPALPRFIQQHRGLRVHVTESYANGAELHGTDVAVCVGPIADSKLVVHRVGTIGTVTCAAPDFIERSRPPLTPADLLPTDCIGLLEPGTDAPRRWVFTRGCASFRISPAAPLAFSDVDAALAAAVRGAGYVQVLSIEADQKTASGLLQPVLEDWSAERWPVFIVHRCVRLTDDEVLAFSAFVAGLFPCVSLIAQRRWGAMR
jgi:LysR family transcriptional regulator for bpeEF and oprC